VRVILDTDVAEVGGLGGTVAGDKDDAGNLRPTDVRAGRDALVAGRDLIIQGSPQSASGRRWSSRDEKRFIERYLRQVRERHGKIEPPDFERRHRVPLDDIYVDTRISEHQDSADANGEQRITVQKKSGAAQLTVMDLPRLINRTVLLGGPGSGKTTATHALANYFASENGGKVPFVVTLRDYAAQHLQGHSIVWHIAAVLEAQYACPAPSEVVEGLLLTGRAVVIFDGLDELLDTSRRREISRQVEQFCSVYPHAPVLVTCRLAGYDQARLDDSIYTCYELDGFGTDQVAEYIYKWFVIQKDGSAEGARSFEKECERVRDLVSNPFLLALICILYRNLGSLPRGLAGLYAKCSELLLGGWDEKRHIHRELQAGNYVEPVIRHLAWWLLNSDDPRAAVAETVMIAKTAEFLRERAFERREQAWAAAAELVQFCRDRMWVITDVGTTREGERLYAFTHRTFLEYFAAAHIAAESETPEDLADALVAYGFENNGAIVPELAIQINDRTSNRSSDRVYTALLNASMICDERGPMLSLLAECLDSTRTSPATVRSLARAILDFRLGEGLKGDYSNPLSNLARSGTASQQQLIAEEISERLDLMFTSADEDVRIDAGCLVLEMRLNSRESFWEQWVIGQLGRREQEIISAIHLSRMVRTIALFIQIISLEDALKMPGGFDVLMSDPGVPVPRRGVPLPFIFIGELINSDSEGKARIIGEFAVIGRHLASHSTLPWVRTKTYLTADLHGLNLSRFAGLMDEWSGLGFAAIVGVITELSEGERMRMDAFPMPVQFRELFRDWGYGRVNFVEILEKTHDA
jgi:hypothetical protein